MPSLADILRDAPLSLERFQSLAMALAREIQERLAAEEVPKLVAQSLEVEAADGGRLHIRSLGTKPLAAGEAAENTAAFQLGTILFQALTGGTPFKGRVALARDLESALEGWPELTMPKTKALVLELLDTSPANRPGLKDAAARLAECSDQPLETAAPQPTQPDAAEPDEATPKPTPPRLPATPATDKELVVEASPRRSKSATDTQDRLFYAEGERMAEQMREDVAEDIRQGILPEPWEPSKRRATQRMWVIRVGVGSVALLLLIVTYKACSKSGPSKPSTPATAGTSAGNMDAGGSAESTESAPVSVIDAAPAPVVFDASIADARAEVEPASELVAPGTGLVESAKKRESTATRSPAAEAPTPQAPRTGAEWLAAARSHKAGRRVSDAYRAYVKAAGSGGKAQKAEAELGAAQMAYLLKRYPEAITRGKKALGYGAPAKKTWTLIAESYCRLGRGREAWTAFSQAGGGNCKK